MDWLTTVRMSMMGWTSGWKALVVALGLMVIVTAIWLTWKPASRDIHKRGAKILEGRRARRKAQRLRQASGESGLTLAGVRIAPVDETKHFKLIGTTGTGKSTAIRELLRCALERGDRAVITDPDSGYLLSFYDRYRGDVVLNPFEKHAVKWNPFTEIREIYDIDQLAGLVLAHMDDAAIDFIGRAAAGHEFHQRTPAFHDGRCETCGQRTGAQCAAFFFELLDGFKDANFLRGILFDGGG